MKSEGKLKLELVAKHICDLEGLVRAMREGTPRGLTWQRQLSNQLAEVDRLLQVLRMTVVMDRPASEIKASATALHAGCRQVSVAIAGSRADSTTRAAMHLVQGLARDIEAAIFAES